MVVTDAILSQPRGLVKLSYQKRKCFKFKMTGEVQDVRPRC